MLASLLCGCVQNHKGKGAQIPSHRLNGQNQEKVDTTLLTLMQMNRRMADEADRQLVEWVKTQDGNWGQILTGAWVKKLSPTEWYDPNNDETPHINEKWRVGMKIYHLDGKLIEDIERTVNIARSELPTAVEETLNEMHAGERRLLACPWYSAYGPHGKGLVGAYENIIIELTLDKKQ